jgi:hypothetical protein
VSTTEDTALYARNAESLLASWEVNVSDPRRACRWPSPAEAMALRRTGTRLSAPEEVIAQQLIAEVGRFNIETTGADAIPDNSHTGPPWRSRQGTAIRPLCP